MSKSNRIKGKFSKLLNCRASSEERLMELSSRNIGLTEQHKPQHPPAIKKKKTKQFRKELKSFGNVGSGSTDGYEWIMKVLARGCKVRAA